MDCLKCKSALHSIMARPRPKALLEALQKVGRVSNGRTNGRDVAPDWDPGLTHQYQPHEPLQTGIKTLENAPESKRANERPEQAATLNIKCLDCSEEGTSMRPCMLSALALVDEGRKMCWNGPRAGRQAGGDASNTTPLNTAD